MRLSRAHFTVALVAWLVSLVSLASLVLAGIACGQLLGTSDVELWSPDSGADAAESPSDGGAPGAVDGGSDAFVPSDASGADVRGVAPSDAGDASEASEDCGALALCNAQCVSLETSGENCGACGHSCGNGDAGCLSGACQPVTVFVDRPIVGFAVDDGKVFVQVEIDAGLTAVNQCATSGCTASSVVIAASTTFSGIAAGGGLIELQSGTSPYAISWYSEATGTAVSSTGNASSVQTLWFSNRSDFIYETAGTDGTAMTLTESADGGIVATKTVGSSAAGSTESAENPYATDGTDLVFRIESADAGNGLAYCAVGSSTCNTPTIVTTSVPNGVNVHAGVVYLVNQGTVTTCPVSGCPASPLPFVALPSATIESTVVDDTGFYWLDSYGAIGMCPLGGCGVAGPVTLVGSQLPAAMFTLYDGFIYYVGAGSFAAGVYKVAEPAP